MTNVKWLLEPETFRGEAQPLVDTLKKLNIEHKVWTFGKPYEEAKNAFKDTDCVVFYGSLQFSRVIKREAKWIPGVYCNLPKFECLYYYPRFGQHLVNADYVMLPLGELSRRKDWLFAKLGKNDQLFIRPSSGFKSFTGEIILEQEWDKTLRFLAFRNDPETLAIVAKPASISYEWRIVVGENKVIAGTQYKKHGEMVRSATVPIEVFDYAQSVLDSIKYKPDPLWTLDICKANDELKVLEVGSFSCAGLYSCDPEAVINAANQIAWKEYCDYQNP